MFDSLITIIASIIAGVIADLIVYFICKWLDRM